MCARPRRSPAFSVVMVGLGMFAALFLPPVPAAAGQAGNPAGITGLITDTSGVVLPG